MADPVRPVSELTAAERADFLAQMRLSAFEEAPLWEIAIGSVDLLTDRRVVHGPWRREDCSAVLVNWAAAGLLGVYRPAIAGQRDDYRLTADEATTLLTDTAAWNDHGVGWLVVTENGERLTCAEWVAQAPDFGNRG
ncbi:MAG: hypothetical protein U0Q22_10570 [Acidimicrobiales bacterium]